MSRSVDILLGEILMAIDLLSRYTAGMDFEAFRTNVEKQDSVVRRLEIIGEEFRGMCGRRTLRPTPPRQPRQLLRPG